MTTMTYAQAIREGLDEVMTADNEVFLIGEDIGEAGGVFGVTKGLWNKYEDRVLDTPISEEALVGAAAGAALVGGRPVAEIMFSDFSTLAMDMLVNQAAKTSYMTGGRLSCPITVRMVTGTAGATAAQHSQSLEAWFTHTPGLKCVAPSTPADAKALIKTAVRDPDPVLFFEHKMLYNVKGDVPAEPDDLPLGKGMVVRSGSDVTIVSYLKTLHEAVQAAEELKRDGISVEVFDPRSLIPFDRNGLGASLERTGRLVIAHEAPTTGGFGAEIAAMASESFWSLLKAPIVRVCGRDTPVPYAPELEGFVLPDAQRITESVHQLMTQEVATGS
ncbi:MAG: alpha-ketoacid dehydrogenase subunit beta [Actinobacteria bacterium]|nr:alpha-ketoacid dehydrogenase subunit beta [Actinomycetota bacterium]